MDEPYSEICKSPYDRLIDIVLDAHTLMRMGGATVRSPSPLLKLKGLINLANKCWEFDARFQKFYNELKSEADGPLYWPVPRPEKGKRRAFTSKLQPALFPVEFHFVDAAVAATLLLYWSCLTALWSGMRRTYEAVDEIARNIKAHICDRHGSTEDLSMIPDTSSLPPLCHRTAFIEAARCVCQSVEYCLQDDARLPLMLSPLNMVHVVLMDTMQHKAEIMWVREALETVRQRGMSMVRYLPLGSEIEPPNINVDVNNENL
jgi:hypothetical protein